MVIKTRCTCGECEVNTYIRKANSNMALALLCIYRYAPDKYVKVEDLLLSHGYKRCGDFSYLTHYGLIQKMLGKREDGSNRNGFYKITGRGIAFCENSLTIPEKFIIRENKHLGFDGKEVNIKDLLGVKFNYNDLLKKN